MQNQQKIFLQLRGKSRENYGKSLSNQFKADGSFDFEFLMLRNIGRFRWMSDDGGGGGRCGRRRRRRNQEGERCVENWLKWKIKEISVLSKKFQKNQISRISLQQLPWISIEKLRKSFKSKKISIFHFSCNFHEIKYVALKINFPKKSANVILQFHFVS